MIWTMERWTQSDKEEENEARGRGRRARKRRRKGRLGRTGSEDVETSLSIGTSEQRKRGAEWNGVGKSE